MAMVRVPASFLIFVCLFLNGCFLFNRDPYPKIAGDPLPEDLAQQELLKLRERTSDIRAFQGLFRGQLKYDGNAYSVRYAIALNHDHNARLDLLPPSNAYPLGIFTAYGSMVQWIDLGERSAMTGDRDSGILMDAFHLPVNEADLLPLVTGTIAPEIFERKDLRVYRNPQSTQLVIVVGDFRYYFVVDTEEARVVEWQRRRESRRRIDLDVHYGRYQSVDGIRVPGRIALTLPRHGVSVELVNVGRKINPVLSDELFQVKIPVGFSIRSAE